MGRMTFVADRQNGDPTVTVVYDVPEGAVDRIMMAFADYYGPTFIDPENPDKGNRPRTGAELIAVWSRKCMDDALNLVQGFESRRAADAAVTGVKSIEYVTK